MEGWDSWRSSSEIKDKCGYVSHVYSALQLTSCQTATGSLLAANLLCQLYLYKWINGSSVTLWTSCASRFKWCTAPIKTRLGPRVAGKRHSSLRFFFFFFFGECLEFWFESKIYLYKSAPSRSPVLAIKCWKFWEKEETSQRFCRGCHITQYKYMDCLPKWQNTWIWLFSRLHTSSLCH